MVAATVGGSGKRAPLADAAGEPSRLPPAASAAGNPAAAAAAAATAPVPATASPRTQSPPPTGAGVHCSSGSGRVVGWVRRDDRPVPVGGSGGAEKDFGEPPVVCNLLER